MRVLNGGEVRALMARRAAQADLMEETIKGHIRIILEDFYQGNSGDSEMITTKNVRELLAEYCAARVIRANKKMITTYSKEYAAALARSGDFS